MNNLKENLAASKKQCTLLSFIFITSILVFSSCYYDNAAEIYGVEECENLSSTYSSDVLPIIERFCYECHDNQNRLGGISLEGHTNITPYVDNGTLVGSIKHTPGFSSMPQGLPKLSDCNIAIIEKWIEEGAFNN